MQIQENQEKGATSISANPVTNSKKKSRPYIE